MKVLYVDQFGKKNGIYSLKQAEYIFKYENINIQVYLSDNTDLKLSNYGIPIINGFKGAYEGNYIKKVFCYIKALKELKKFVIKENITILHLQWFSLPWIEWIFIKRIKKYCKVIVTIHDVIPFNVRPLEIKSLDFIYKNSDYLLFHTDNARETFKKYYKSKTRSQIITQGFCSKCDYEIIDKKIARNYFGIPEDKIVFLYYGTIRQSKGLDVLLKAIRKANAENKQTYFLAAGSFQKVNEDYYRKLTEESVNDTNSYINYKFVPTEEEAYYFCAADVCCLPYREITQSAVAQNAIMYELPIIATDIDAMKDVARQGYNAELFSVDNVEELKEKILKLTDNKELVLKYRIGSKYLSENEFSLEKKGKIVANVYKKLC